MKKQNPKSLAKYNEGWNDALKFAEKDLDEARADERTFIAKRIPEIVLKWAKQNNIETSDTVELLTDFLDIYKVTPILFFISFFP